ncbi:hypothetical protein kam1_501 [Methylacidiphilum kamchatkense Kam1]|uniref:Uncharacterized protein n=1 Tax=Methylacidiphilum kamchatkense Kam1 TaxID=1202785 RepID=A0A516TKH0_9BACT|nr:hypothetical protein kam1_501 [Methylacidiphilum kamchatkense Kam1]
MALNFLLASLNRSCQWFSKIICPFLYTPPKLERIEKPPKEIHKKKPANIILPVSRIPNKLFNSPSLQQSWAVLSHLWAYGDKAPHL